MDENAEPTDQTLSVSNLLEIDKVCRQFEAAWKAGQGPRIEDFLGRVDEALRGELRRELQAIDAEFRVHPGDGARPPTDAPSLKVFAQRLIDSGLMAAAEYEAFYGSLPADSRPQTAEELAQEMYRRKLLTRFQAHAVYQGKTRGLVVGNYVVQEKVGEGGMGYVYKAKHRKMDRIVALKVLPSSATRSAESIRRFDREIRAAAKLSHPNVVTAYDADEAHGVRFLVMEYVEGKDLYSAVKDEGPLAVSVAVDCVVQAARGLEYAHALGVIHRDIKPANLLWEDQKTVKILDMGLARIEAFGAADQGLSHSGQFLGTPDYMAPEQALDAHLADARADVYSLGCTLCYLLTGRPPYGGQSIAQQIVAHRERLIPSLRDDRPDVPEWLDAVFRKMIAKRPEDRQQSMTEVIADLKQCELPQGSAPPQTGPPPIRVSETLGLGRGDVSTSPDRVEWPLPGEISLHRWVPRARRRAFPWTLLARLSKRQKIGLAAALGATFLLILLGVLIQLRTADGTLIVEVNEADATVQVLSEKGEVQIQRKGEKGSLSISVDPSKHRLRVEKDGFQVFTQEFSIAAGGKETIRARLERLPVGTHVATPPPAARNLIENPSFEDMRDGRPDHWQKVVWSGQPVCEIAQIAHEGRRSLCISASEPADAVYEQEVVVKPHTDYRLSGWVKTDGVRPEKGARGAVINTWRFGPPPRALVGTNDWTWLQLVFNTKQRDSILVQCQLGNGGPATGKAWFDDLQLTLVNAAPAAGSTPPLVPAEAASPAKQSQGGGPNPPAAPRAGVAPGLVPPGEWVDLLQYADLERDRVSGQWRQEGNDLVVTGKGDSRMMLPIVVDGAYEVEVKFTRTDGIGPVTIPISLGAMPLCVVLGDGREGARGKNGSPLSAVMKVGNWECSAENATARPGDLDNGRSYSATILVQPSDGQHFVRVFLDGSLHVECESKRTDVGLHPRNLLPKLKRPGLGAGDCTVLFHSVKLRTSGSAAGGAGKAYLLAKGQTYPEPYTLTQYAGAWGWTRFYDLAPSQAHLIGFEIHRLVAPDKQSVLALRPLYQSPGARLKGMRCGWYGGDNEQETVTAKDGYAVHGMVVGTVKIPQPGGDVTAVIGLKLLFARLRGARVDLNDTYESDWIGQAGSSVRLGGGELPAIGLYGHWSGLGIVSLGLALAPEDPAVKWPTDWAAQPDSTPRPPAVGEGKPAPPPAIAPFDETKAKQHQQAWAKHLGVPVEITNSIGMKLVLIPAGEFTMGSSDGFPNEKPPHSVRITRPFYVGQYEVTIGQFRQFVTGSRNTGVGDSWRTAFPSQTDDHPVVTVSWNDAKAFCNWLSQKERKEYRLPTEAEWEYACRAGTVTKWSFGDNASRFAEYAWYEGNSGSQTHSIGQKKPNAWGFHDMHGNAREWCADWYGSAYYATSPVADPGGPSSGTERVLRGGCWTSRSEWNTRSALRFMQVADYRYHDLGFRVSRDL